MSRKRAGQGLLFLHCLCTLFRHLLFVTNTTTLSTLISCLRLNHRFYATFSVHPSNLHSYITHLQNDPQQYTPHPQQISSWMTVSLLAVISSKTEFLPIALKQLFSKVHNSSLISQHNPLRSQLRLLFWRTPHLLRPNLRTFQIVLLPHLWTSIYSRISCCVDATDLILASSRSLLMFINSLTSLVFSNLSTDVLNTVFSLLPIKFLLALKHYLY